MRAPKHIRQARTLELANAKADYQENGAPGSTTKAADGRTLGYRMTPDLRQGYHAHINFSPMGSSSNGIQSLSSRQRSNHFAMSDNEFYDTKLDVTGGTREEAKIRVGTTPARKLLLTDKETGEKYLARIPAKPKWRNVGLSGTFPKDGGK